MKVITVQDCLDLREKFKKNTVKQPSNTNLQDFSCSKG